MTKPCTWNGIEYPSISALAKELGVHVSTASKWINKGYQGDKDVPSATNAPNFYVYLDGKLCAVPMKRSDRLFQDNHRVLYRQRLGTLTVLGQANQVLNENVTYMSREELLKDAPAELVREVQSRYGKSRR